MHTIFCNKTSFLNANIRELKLSPVLPIVRFLLTLSSYKTPHIPVDYWYPLSEKCSDFAVKVKCDCVIYEIVLKI